MMLKCLVIYKLTMLMKKIIALRFHTSNAIHIHSGKIADLSTVLKSTKSHNLIISAQWLFKIQTVLPAVLLPHLPAVRTLVQPALENPKVQHKLLHERKEIQEETVCAFLRSFALTLESLIIL